MDVFSVAAEMLGEMSLSPGQLANLRAIDAELYRRTAGILRAADGRVAERELTAEEARGLREMLVAAILDTLTPAQRRELGPTGR